MSRWDEYVDTPGGSRWDEFVDTPGGASALALPVQGFEGADTAGVYGHGEMDEVSLLAIDPQCAVAVHAVHAVHAHPHLLRASLCRRTRAPSSP